MKDEIKIQGIAMYASLAKPNILANAYILDLVVDDKTAESLEALGLHPSKTKDGNLKTYEDFPGKVFKFKRKAVTKEGVELKPPVVVDAETNVVPADLLIGNGSKVEISANIYEYSFQGKKGLSAGLNGVQILELVEYKGGPSFEKKEGFTVKRTHNANTDPDEGSTYDII